MTANNPDKSEAARQKTTCESVSQAGRARPGQAGPGGASEGRTVPGGLCRPDPAGQTELKNGLSGPGLTGSDWV